MNVKFSLVGGDAENLKIVFDGAFGTSATNILGRFAHGSPEIQAMIDEITAHDAEANPDAILAEIVHLPENRIGNILLRPVFRPYEIAYLAKSAVDEEHQISLDDLYISVKGQRIFLRSKRLNKIIIPRLSSAHNFSARSLPIYHFLCDLQSEGKRGGLMFSWGDVQNLFMTLPRVEMGNVILQAASWRLRKKEYEHLAKIPAHQLVAEMQKVCEKHHLPRFVALADGDNELLVDLENAQSIEMLISTVDKRNEIKLVEFLFDSESVPVCDEHQQAYTNEFVAVLKKEIPKREPKSTPTPPQKTQNPPQRYFALGSEWLYFKFYIGEKNADNLLTEVIKPLTENLLEENLISKWFFIRYSDPDFHIRFRVKIANTEAFNTIITQLYEAIAPWIEQRIVWKVQTDTYKRELERYGNTTIDIAEELFFHDSVALVNMLAMIEGDEGEIIRWKFGLRQVDELLDNFGFSLEQKLEFMKGLRDSFAREFNMERTLKKQLDDKYRKEKESIEAMLNRNLDAESEYLPLFETLYEKAERLKPVVNTLLEMQKNQELEVHLHSLLGSYIHMTLNRLNRSNPRLHELIMYDFLYRYYQSLFARKNKQKEPQLTQEEN